MLYKENHTVCDLMRLSFFTCHHTLEIRPSCVDWPFSAFHFWVVVPGIGANSWFHHSLTEGHSDRFQFLAITYKATMNNCVESCEWTQIFISLK